jgi:N utilization substance protein B
MIRRSRVREVVLQVLYQDDINPDRDLSVSDQFLRRRLADEADAITFANTLLSGVRRNRSEIDSLLSERAANWRLERMAVTDRNILRLAAFEMLYSDTPDRVVINEAVELAKRFGAKQSSQFVNGILDRLFRDRGEKKDEGGAEGDA